MNLFGDAPKIISWLLLVGVAAAVVAHGPPMQNDMTQFLPPALTREQKLLLDEVRRGPSGRLILLELSGDSVARLVDASKTLRSQLMKSGQFQQVLNGTEIPGDDALESLFAYRYLLTPQTQEKFSAEALRRVFVQRLQELANPVGMPDKQRLPADPTASFRLLMGRWRQGLVLKRQGGVWFSKDGTGALLMLQSRYPVFALDDQERAVSAVRNAFGALPGSADIKLTMSGPPVFAVDSRHNIQREAAILSLLAGIGVSALLLLVFRSPPLVLLVALPLGSGILAGTAVVILVFGALHAVTLAFGITLLGVAVDYPIHLFTHAGGGRDMREAMADIWPIIRLGLLTTSLGFCALLFSQFGGLSQFAVFAITGLLAAVAVTRFVLPALVTRVTATSALESSATTVFRRLQIPWLPVLIVVPAAVFLAFQGDRLWEHDLARLSPVSAEAKAMDRRLRAEFLAPDAMRLLLITGATAEQVLEHSENLEPRLRQQVSAGNLSGFNLPSRYLPSAQTQRKSRDNLPDSARLREALASALRGLPFKPGLFEPFVEDVARSRRLAPMTPEQIAVTPLGLRLSPLLGQRYEHWVGVVALSGIRNESAMNQLAAEAGDSIFYLDLSRESSRLVADYRNQALRLSVIGAAVILFVLLFALRNLRLVVRVAAPVTAAVISTAAILALLGEQLSLFHIAALLLVLGIGIDYALFIAYIGLESPRFPATVAAIVLCSLSTLLVFGLLLFSSVPLLNAMGLTVSSGTLLSLIFSAMMVHNSDPRERLTNNSK